MFSFNLTYNQCIPVSAFFYRRISENISDLNKGFCLNNCFHSTSSAGFLSFFLASNYEVTVTKFVHIFNDSKTYIFRDVGLIVQNSFWIFFTDWLDIIKEISYLSDIIDKTWPFIIILYCTINTSYWECTFSWKLLQLQKKRSMKMTITWEKRQLFLQVGDRPANV